MHKDEIKRILEMAGLEPTEYDITLADFAMRVQRCGCLDEIMRYAEISEYDIARSVVANLGLNLALKWGLFNVKIN